MPASNVFSILKVVCFDLSFFFKFMGNAEIIAGLDIGSQNIRIAVGEAGPDIDGLNIIGLAEGRSGGVNKGIVRSIEAVVDSISAVIARAEKMTALKIDHAIVSISGSHIVTQESKGVIAVSRADGEIREEDVERVLDAAQAVSVPPNYEILHVIPRSYAIDNQTGIKDPIGMNGVRLEVEAQIIEGQSAPIRNVTKAVTLSGLAIADLNLAILAASFAALTERQKDLGVALVNIGAATTSVISFEEGDILQIAVLPVGSAHITNDIAIGLRTNVDIAEEIKLQYGQARPDEVAKKDEVDLKAVAEQESGSFSRRHLAEIIEARVEEIFHFADKELRAVNRSGKLPAGVVLTGGGAKLPGILEAAKRVFRLPASIGLPLGVNSAIDRINDPALTTVIGLVIAGQSLAASQGRGFVGRISLRLVPEFFRQQLAAIVRIFKP